MGVTDIFAKQIFIERERGKGFEKMYSRLKELKNELKQNNPMQDGEKEIEYNKRISNLLTKNLEDKLKEKNIEIPTF